MGAGCTGSARATNANNVCVLCLPTVFPRPLLSGTPCYKTDWPILVICVTFLFHLEFSSAVSHSGWLALAQIVLVPEKRHGERRERIHTMLNGAWLGVQRSQARSKRATSGRAGLGRGRPSWPSPLPGPTGPPAGQRAPNISPTLFSTLVLTLVFIVRIG